MWTFGTVCYWIQSCSIQISSQAPRERPESSPRHEIQWLPLNLSSQPCVSVGRVVTERSVVGLVFHDICMRQLQMPLDWVSQTHHCLFTENIAMCQYSRPNKSGGDEREFIYSLTWWSEALRFHTLMMSSLKRTLSTAPHMLSASSSWSPTNARSWRKK